MKPLDSLLQAALVGPLKDHQELKTVLSAAKENSPARIEGYDELYGLRLLAPDERPDLLGPWLFGYSSDTRRESNTVVSNWNGQCFVKFSQFSFPFGTPEFLILAQGTEASKILSVLSEASKHFEPALFDSDGYLINE